MNDTNLVGKFVISDDGDCYRTGQIVGIAAPFCLIRFDWVNGPKELTHPMELVEFSYMASVNKEGWCRYFLFY